MPSHFGREPQPDGVHTIPVPRGWTPEQAWEAIARGELLTDPEPEWANVVVKGGRFLKLIRPTVLDRIRAVARDVGYAVAVHGSETRDLDLIAAPWTDEAVSAHDLVEHLVEGVPLVIREQPPEGWPAGEPYPNPEERPHGRIAWALFGSPAHAYIDLSVMPRA